MMRGQAFILAVATLLAACTTQALMDGDGNPIPDIIDRGAMYYPTVAQERHIDGACSLVYDVRNDGRTANACAVCRTRPHDPVSLRAFADEALRTVYRRRFAATSGMPRDGIWIERRTLQLSWNHDDDDETWSTENAPPLAGHCGVPADGAAEDVGGPS